MAAEMSVITSTAALLAMSHRLTGSSRSHSAWSTRGIPTTASRHMRVDISGRVYDPVSAKMGSTWRR